MATVGGGAGIPLVTQRLSEQFRVPVITTPQSQLNVAAGAALLADRDLAADAPTGLSAAADAPTGIAPAAWAAGAAGLAASESAADGAPSATFRALAWSQDDAPGGEPVPYTGEDYSADVYTGPTDARPPVAFAPGEEPAVRGRAGAAALVQAAADPVRSGGSGGAARDRRPGDHADGQQRCARARSPRRARPSPSARHRGSRRHRRRRQTVTVTGSDGQPTTTVVTPPPPPPSSTHHDDHHVADHHVDHDDDNHHDDNDHHHHHHDDDDDHDDVAAGTQATSPSRSRAPSPPAGGASAERSAMAGPAPEALTDIPPAAREAVAALTARAHRAGQDPGVGRHRHRQEFRARDGADVRCGQPASR